MEIKNIDSALWKAISKSPYHQIDYENLLAINPAKIREEEMNLSIQEEHLDIPKQLEVENIFIPSSDKSRTIRLKIYRPKGKNTYPYCCISMVVLLYMVLLNNMILYSFG